MKKIVVMFLLLGLLLCCSSYATAGVVVYEKDDLKVGVEDVSPCVLFDVMNKETLVGVKSSIVEYKIFNLDIGAIGEMDKLDEEGEIDLFLGLSADVNNLKFKDNIYGSLGLFVSPGIIDSGPNRWGGYAGLTYKF